MKLDSIRPSSLPNVLEFLRELEMLVDFGVRLDFEAEINPYGSFPNALKFLRELEMMFNF